MAARSPFEICVQWCKTACVHGRGTPPGGVPQNYTEGAMWYRRAAEQGDSLAQYSLGLLYDKGQGVPRDVIEASKWLNLSTAAAPPRAREARARIRDAVGTKMTRGEIARARARALGWAPVPEH